MAVTSIQNPFHYDQVIIDQCLKKLEAIKLDDEGCGDKVKIEITDQAFYLCKGCSVIISELDLKRVLKGRKIENENVDPSFEFLGHHAIFRCEDDHEEPLKWTFQCLDKDQIDEGDHLESRLDFV